MTSVAICTVTWNSREHLEGYFAALDKLEADGADLRVVLVDCASEDGSLARAEEARHSCRHPVETVSLDENLGFAGGMNTALAAARAEWIWALNPDARPLRDTWIKLRSAAHRFREPRFGSITPRMVRDAPTEAPLLDACGMFLTRTWRHLDRGSGDVDHGQWVLHERVFGGTGAGTLYRREALDDVAIDGKVFDEDFHSFREDAELAFRLQERGWECLYAPEAVVEHRRFNLPQRRAAMPAHVNLHSLKNRYLLRLYHQSVPNLLWTLPFTLFRDALALGYVALREPTSFGAYRWLWQNRRRLFQRRRAIRQRITAPGAVERWFRSDALPLDPGSLVPDSGDPLDP